MPDKPEIMIATADETVTVDGVEVRVRSGESTAFATDRIVLDNPELWTEFEAHYEDGTGPDEDAPESSGDAPPEPTGDDPNGPDSAVRTGDVANLTTDSVPADEAKPDAKDVRAWAKENGIDLPARGPIPDAFIERYKADQVQADG